MIAAVLAMNDVVKVEMSSRPATGNGEVIVVKYLAADRRHGGVDARPLVAFEIADVL